MPTVWLRRTSLPVWPASAALNSGRVAWFSMLSGSACESASTLPLASITVARALAAFASSATSLASGRLRSLCTRFANNCVFCVSSELISALSDCSHACRITKSRMRVAVPMTSRNESSSFAKIRLFIISGSRSGIPRPARFSAGEALPDYPLFSPAISAHRRPPSAASRIACRAKRHPGSGRG